MSTLQRITLAGIAIALTAAPASAGDPLAGFPFHSKIHCHGLFQPGDAVPFRLHFQELDGLTHGITATVTINPPRVGTATVFERIVVLHPNELRDFTNSVTLRPNAHHGRHTLALKAVGSSVEINTVCVFRVQ